MEGSYSQISVSVIGLIAICYSIYSLIMFLFFKCTEMEERGKSIKISEECKAKNNGYRSGITIGFVSAIVCGILLSILIYRGI